MKLTELQQRLIRPSKEPSITESTDVDTGATRDRANTVIDNVDSVEAKKDKLNLAPNIEFVSNNIELFEAGLQSILARTTSKESRKWSEGILFENEEDVVPPQISPEDGRQLLARMPEALIELSLLECVDYHTFGDIRIIPVPGFDNEGNLDKKKIEPVSVDNFPRAQDHPSRILVGVSNGLKIFPTPIPSSVSEDERARYLYQVHVFLHEFFHTVELFRRKPEYRNSIKLEVDGEEFSLQDWWRAFEQLILSGIEPKCVSMYANTYFDKLNQKTKDSDEAVFTFALAEQICEAFVAYQLGIISNNQGWTNFRTESFGNTEQLSEFTKGNSPSANLKWILMDKLCRAKVIAS